MRADAARKSACATSTAQAADAAVADLQPGRRAACTHMIKFACGVPLLAAGLAHARWGTIGPLGQLPPEFFPGRSLALAPPLPALAGVRDEGCRAFALLAAVIVGGARFAPGELNPEPSPVCGNRLLREPPLTCDLHAGQQAAFGEQEALEFVAAMRIEPAGLAGALLDRRVAQAVPPHHLADGIL